MDFTLTRREKRFLKLAEDIVARWRAVLHLDPLWKISLDVFDDSEIPEALARIDASTTEYYMATIELSCSLFELKEARFVSKMNEIACHELLHLVMVDFFRTAQLAATESEEMLKELRYKYEQFTSRLQRAFSDMFNANVELEGISEKLDAVKNLYLCESYPDKWKDMEKLLGIESAEVQTLEENE
jgi:hypothetical protein